MCASFFVCLHARAHTHTNTHTRTDIFPLNAHRALLHRAHSLRRSAHTHKPHCRHAPLCLHTPHLHTITETQGRKGAQEVTSSPAPARGRIILIQTIPDKPLIPPLREMTVTPDTAPGMAPQPAPGKAGGCGGQHPTAVKGCYYYLQRPQAEAVTPLQRKAKPFQSEPVRKFLPAPNAALVRS